MNNINLIQTSIRGNNCIQNKKVSLSKANFTASTQPNKPSKEMIFPGFNDHNIIMFGKTNKKEYAPIDAVEQNSIDVHKKVMPSTVMIHLKVCKTRKDGFSGKEVTDKYDGIGSGSIIDKQGHILTNYHVVEDSSEIKVQLDDDTFVPAKLIGTDITTDVAVLKLDLPEEKLEKLSVIEKADSSEAVGGQRVYLLGNPLGHFKSFTSGLLSSANREIVGAKGQLTCKVLQTDASANTGSSGGPMVNSRGEQIGLLSQISTNPGGSISFAIPMNTVMKSVNDIIDYGHVKKPSIGIKGAEPLDYLPLELHRALPKTVESGLFLNAIEPGSPIAKAGLKGGWFQLSPEFSIGGDIITKINDIDVSNMTQVGSIIEELGIGATLNIEYYRFADIIMDEEGVFAKCERKPRKAKVKIEQP